jgi:hypothetical protein
MAKQAAVNCADTYHTLNGVINPFPVNSTLHTRFLVVSSTGILYLQRPPDTIVRFPKVNPFKDPDTWAFMLLCRHIPFWNVESLATEGLYIPSAIQYGIIDTPEKIAQLLRDNHAQRFKSASLTDDNIATFVQSLHACTAPPSIPQIVRIDRNG